MFWIKNQSLETRTYVKNTEKFVGLQRIIVNPFNMPDGRLAVQPVKSAGYCYPLCTKK